MNLLKLLVDKNSQMSPGEGALYSIVSILMVFVILLIIIGVTTLVFKAYGLFDLKKELDDLINVRRPENIQAIKEARSLGDLSENAEYDAARNEQAQVEARIKELELEYF